MGLGPGVRGGAGRRRERLDNFRICWSKDKGWSLWALGSYTEQYRHISWESCH